MTNALFAPIQRDVVVVHGPDATKFLQSLLSQDLDPVGVGESTHALLLEPKGKLVVDIRAARVEADVWWLLCAAGFGPVLAQGLNRFKIRVKAEIEDRSASIAAIALRHPGQGGLDADVASGIVPVQTDWPGAPGIEFVGDPDAIAGFAARLARLGITEIDADAYETLRVEAGVPRQGYDIDESTIAQEAFLERDAVSFTKGCFLGQELVCRIDSRGHVNRLLRRLRSDAPIERGAAVVADDKEVGTVTTSAGNVALATIRRAVEPGSAVVVRASGKDVSAQVEAVDV
jgi:tRNA-modifying protein YgfZ